MDRYDATSKSQTAAIDDIPRAPSTLSTEAIAGISGGIGGLLVIILIVYFVLIRGLRRYRKEGSFHGKLEEGDTGNRRTIINLDILSPTRRQGFAVLPELSYMPSKDVSRRLSRELRTIMKIA